MGCASAAAAGGSCKAGALAQGFSALAGHIPGVSDTGLLGRMAVGALASKVGGGKAENGALSAAFEYLFNELSVGDEGKPSWSWKSFFSNFVSGMPGYVAEQAVEKGPIVLSLAVDIATVYAVATTGPAGAAAAAERFGLTKLMSQGTYAIVDADRVVNVAMPIGRSATADFAALADTYGATVKVSGKVSFFELEGVTVSLRNFAKSGAEWTIQA